MPRRYLRHDLLRDLRHQFRGYLHAVQFLDLFGDVLLAHPAGVEADDLLLHPVRVPAVLADNLCLEAAVPVPGNLDLYLPQLCLHRLPGVPIAVVGRRFQRLRSLAALPPQFLVQLYLHGCLNHVPEHLLHCRHDLRGAGEMLTFDILFQ